MIQPQICSVNRNLEISKYNLTILLYVYVMTLDVNVPRNVRRWKRKTNKHETKKCLRRSLRTLCCCFVIFPYFVTATKNTTIGVQSGVHTVLYKNSSSKNHEGQTCQKIIIFLQHLRMTLVTLAMRWHEISFSLEPLELFRVCLWLELMKFAISRLLNLYTRKYKHDTNHKNT